MAKKLTLITFILIFIIGSFGAFVPSFQMEGYIAFIKAFTPTFITLLTSIGVSRVTDKMKRNPLEANEDIISQTIASNGIIDNENGAK